MCSGKGEEHWGAFAPPLGSHPLGESYAHPPPPPPPPNHHQIIYCHFALPWPKSWEKPCYQQPRRINCQVPRMKPLARNFHPSTLFNSWLLFCSIESRWLSGALQTDRGGTFTIYFLCFFFFCFCAYCAEVLPSHVMPSGETSDANNSLWGKQADRPCKQIGFQPPKDDVVWSEECHNWESERVREVGYVEDVWV